MTRPKKIISYFALLITLTGLIYSLILGDEIRFYDESDNLILAENLAEFNNYTLNGIDLTAFRAPGYPFILSVFTRIINNIIFLRMVNFILLALVCCMIYFFVSGFSSVQIGIIAAAMIFFYPVLFYTAGTFYPQTMGSFLFISSMYYLRKSNENIRNTFIGGFFYGSLVLTIPAFLLNLPFIILFPFILSYPKKIMIASAFISAVVLLVGIWTVRNYLVFDNFVPVSTNAGINFLLGNSGNTVPNAGRNTDISNYEREAEELNEIEANDFYFHSAVQWIRSNPSSALGLYLLKVINYFNYSNNLATKSQQSIFFDIVMFITYYSILLLTLLRLFEKKKFPLNKMEIFVLLIYISNAFLSALFFPRIRFRLPFDILLFIPVSIFIYNKFRDSRKLKSFIQN